MAKLSKKEQEELKSFLDIKGLLGYLNKYLKKNNLNYEIDSLKIKTIVEGSTIERENITMAHTISADVDPTYVNGEFKCPSGYRLAETISSTATIKYVCRRITQSGI